MAEKLWRVEVKVIEEGDVVNETHYVKAETQEEVVAEFEWATSLFVTQASELEVQAYDSGYIEGWDDHAGYAIAKERMDAYDGVGHQVIDFTDDFGVVTKQVFTCGICRGTFDNMELISGKTIHVEGYKTMWNVCQSCSDIVDAIDG